MLRLVFVLSCSLRYNLKCEFYKRKYSFACFPFKKNNFLIFQLTFDFFNFFFFEKKPVFIFTVLSWYSLMRMDYVAPSRKKRIGMESRSETRHLEICCQTLDIDPFGSLFYLSRPMLYYNYVILRFGEKIFTNIF